MKTETSLVVLLLAACSPGTPAPKPVTDAAAIVNGVAISEAEVGLLTGGVGHGTGGDRRKAVVENLVQQELAAQKAVSLGLDKDPRFIDAMRAAESQYATLRRRELSQAYYRKEIDEGTTVTDAEARAYYEAHVSQLRTEYFVTQIFRRDRPSIEAALAKLAAGTPFDQVAAEGYPEVPPGAKKPWEFGPFSFRQLPDSWKPVLEGLEPGAVTGIIEGEGNRFWVLQLDQKIENPDLGFPQLAEGLKAQIRSERVEALRVKKEAELRATAKIEIRPAPAPVP